jgi:phosphate transport system substrate-binding protein
MIFRTICTAFIFLTISAPITHARDQIRAVGSSTVFPFVAAAAEQYADATGAKAPIVEAIGTGAGFVEFCKGSGEEFPDIVNASRLMMDSEKAICAKNNVGEIGEIEIGKDGIIIASNANSDAFPLTKKNLFFALAKQVPVKGALVANPYRTWKEVDASLPNTKIEMYGPSITSGTRDSFVELVMEPVCMALPEFIAAYKDEKTRKQACHGMREDGVYVEAGENDNLIVQKLSVNEKATGIFGYSFLDQNIDKVVAHAIDGVEPEYEMISDGSYSIARSMYVYVKKSHLSEVTGLKAFLTELVSENALSDEGYLSDKGLIPLSDTMRENVRKKVADL